MPEVFHPGKPLPTAGLSVVTAALGAAHRRGVLELCLGQKSFSVMLQWSHSHEFSWWPAAALTSTECIVHGTGRGSKEGSFVTVWSLLYQFCYLVWLFWMNSLSQNIYVFVHTHTLGLIYLGRESSPLIWKLSRCKSSTSAFGKLLQWLIIIVIKLAHCCVSSASQGLIHLVLARLWRMCLSFG